MSPQPRYRIAQLSDIHLAPLPRPTLAELASKRVLGYISWRTRREAIHRTEVLAALVADLHTQSVDHVVVTGDLVNISLPIEFERALAWLEQLGPTSRVSIIPGNHDAYVSSGMREGWALWRPYMGDADSLQGWPWMRSLGDLVLFGLSTAVPTAWGFASGRLGAAQIARLAELMAAVPARKARVVLLHHPPIEGWSKPRKSLEDAYLLRAVLQRTGADLVLCGHEHRLGIGSLPGPRRPIRVIGAPSASTIDRPGQPTGGYLVHGFTELADGWRVTTEHRRLGPDGTIVVTSVGHDPATLVGAGAFSPNAIA